MYLNFLDFCALFKSHGEMIWLTHRFLSLDLWAVAAHIRVPRRGWRLQLMSKPG